MQSGLALWLPQWREASINDKTSDTQHLSLCSLSYPARISASKLLIELQQYDVSSSVSSSQSWWIRIDLDVYRRDLVTYSEDEFILLADCQWSLRIVVGWRRWSAWGTTFAVVHERIVWKMSYPPFSHVTGDALNICTTVQNWMKNLLWAISYRYVPLSYLWLLLVVIYFQTWYLLGWVNHLQGEDFKNNARYYLGKAQKVRLMVTPWYFVDHVLKYY